jgi:hypothetical protein
MGDAPNACADLALWSQIAQSGAMGRPDLTHLSQASPLGLLNRPKGCVSGVYWERKDFGCASQLTSDSVGILGVLYDRNRFA